MVPAGRESAGAALRIRQSMLLTWSDRIMPVRLNPGGRGDFERITLDLSGNRAEERQPDPSVVSGRGEYDSRAAPGLLAPCLRV